MKRFFKIDRYNTAYDWGLTLTAKETPPPEVKTNYVSLDGMSGTLDLTEALTGEPTYNDRTVAASFMCSEGTFYDRVHLVHDIITALHGKKVQIIEPDDPEHYFLGRVHITPVLGSHAYTELEMEAICEPWRYALNETERMVNVNGSTDVVLNNTGVRTLSPTVSVSGTVTLSFDGFSQELTAGTYKLTDLRLRQGDNVIGVSGSGTVTFTYREATL